MFRSSFNLNRPLINTPEIEIGHESPAHLSNGSDTISIAALFESPVSEVSAPRAPEVPSVTPNAKHLAYTNLAQEVSSLGADILNKNTVSKFVGNTLEAMGQKVAAWELGTYNRLFSPYSTGVGQLSDVQVEPHFQWVSNKSEALAKAFSQKIKGVDETLLQAKLRPLLNYCPALATVFENAVMGKALAALWSPVLASPPADTTLGAIDFLHRELQGAIQADASNEDIGSLLNGHMKALQAKGTLVGRLSEKIKQNPSNNALPLDSTLAKWLAKGERLQFSEPVLYGVANPNEQGPALKTQALMDALLQAVDVNGSACAENTPVVVKMRGNDEAFQTTLVKAFRARLLVNAKVRVRKPNDAADHVREVDIKQAPLIPTLEHILCGRYHLVHPDVLAILDGADIFEVSCSHNARFAHTLQHRLRNPESDVARSLKRTMAARLLIPALCLEGTSLAETARNLAGPTLIGVAMDVGKNYIPERYALLKTLVMQVFFLGVDAADNLAGAWPEVQSLLETMGVEHVNYQSVFNEPEPEGKAAKAKEFLKLAFGLRSATGEAGPAVATGLRSAVIGTLFGNALSLGYTMAIGALDLNPGLRALIGMPAIVGTSLGIAINFAVNHADLTLAFKKQIHDGTLMVPESVAREVPSELNAYCSDLAKRQLMLLSGTGPAAQAFTFAPFASLLNLLGYLVPMKAVEAVVTPLMPGMENLVRLVAMSQHSNGVEKALEKMDEKAIHAAAQGKMPTFDQAEFDLAMYGRTGSVTADLTLMAGGLLVGLLGRFGHQRLQIAHPADAPLMHDGQPVDIDAVVLLAREAALRARQAVSALPHVEQGQV